MIRISELKLPLSALPVQARRAADAPHESEADRQAVAHPVAALTESCARILGISPQDVLQLQVFKRSFDARKADLMAVFTVDLQLKTPELEHQCLTDPKRHQHLCASPDMSYRPPRPELQAALQGIRPDATERPVVVGFGPCGMFAALILAQMGLRPIVLERGKAVRQRTQDTWDLWRKKVLHPESNVQFGEGGAGTFSDGKLYSQVRDPRHLGRKVMHELVQAGAPADILFDAHPHIGTFKLVKVVERIRAQIQALGGEIRFGHRVDDVVLEPLPEAGHFQIKGLKVLNLVTGSRDEWPASHVVMAPGHSARDTFALLYEHGVAMQAKPFSVGFRIEHPQSVIDRARWGRHAGHPLLGAADYKLVHHATNGRTVYSFCMCPGGTVVAATSEPERVVTNGMSQYSRAERNANAGLVVGITPADYPDDEAAMVQAFGAERGHRFAAEAQAFKSVNPAYAHPMSGIALQRRLEHLAYTLGGSSYDAPAQRVGDFLAGKPSQQLGVVLPSYRPGVRGVDLQAALPAELIAALQEALPVFGRKIKGFDMPDALLTGVETRTSSPIKMPRTEDYESTNVRGLYPAGEGASYAGGILSAGIDGIKVAEAVAYALLRSAAMRSSIGGWVENN